MDSDPRGGVKRERDSQSKSAIAGVGVGANMSLGADTSRALAEFTQRLAGHIAHIANTGRIAQNPSLFSLPESLFYLLCHFLLIGSWTGTGISLRDYLPPICSVTFTTHAFPHFRCLAIPSFSFFYSNLLSVFLRARPHHICDSLSFPFPTPTIPLPLSLILSLQRL